MSKTAKHLLINEALRVLATGSIIIIASMISLQTYVSYQKSISLKKQFLDEVSRQSDQIFLFSKLNKLDSLNSLVYEIQSNYKDVIFCINILDSSASVTNKCGSNTYDYYSTSIGPDNSISIYYKIPIYSKFFSSLISTLILSLLYLLLFSYFIFKLNKKLTIVFVNSLFDIVDRVNSIGNGDRSIFKTKQQIIEINQIESELNKLVLKLVDLESKIEDRISKKYALQVAHDIRSPVGALKMLFSIVEFNKESKDFAHLCLERIDSIANDILKTQKSNTNLELVTLSNLELIIQRLESEFQLRYSLNSRFIDFEKNKLQTNHGINILKISNHLLSRIFTILIQNTFDEFSDPSSVKVRLNISAHNPQSVIFTYFDNGPGFNSILLERFNSKKSFVSTKSTEFSGHGIGLSYLMDTVSRFGQIIFIGNNISDKGVKIQFSLNLLPNELHSHFTTTPKEPPHANQISP